MPLPYKIRRPWKRTRVTFPRQHVEAYDTMDIEITPLEPSSLHRGKTGDEEDTGEETPVNKKLVALSIGVVILLLLGGIQTSFLYGTQFLNSKSEYNFSVASTSVWWDCNWSYVKKITIDHTKVQADETDFPVLLYEASDADLATYAQDTGNDIVFVDRWNVTQYHHELEKFDGNTGELWAWVNVTSLSSTRDTVLYMYYGNPECGSQQQVSGTWDARFAMVQHLAETSGSYNDATSHGNEGIPVGGVTRGVIGKIDGAVGLDGTTGSINTGTSSSLNITGQISLEGWVQDPPMKTGRIRQLTQVRILDKRNETISLHRCSHFTISRTISANNDSEVLIALLIAPGISITDITMANASVLGGSYSARKPGFPEEQCIERIRRGLPSRLSSLQTIVYSTIFPIQKGTMVPFQVDAVVQNSAVLTGRISYLVISTDGGFDFEGTTHWNCVLDLFGWLHPLSFFKNKPDFLFRKNPDNTSSINRIKAEPYTTNYFKAPKNSFGVNDGYTKQVNCSFFWNFINMNAVWGLQRSFDGKTWSWVNESLVETKHPSEDNAFEKSTLNITVHKNWYYRVVYKINHELQSYYNNSENCQYLLNFSVKTNETYNTFFDWSDLKNLTGFTITPSVQNNRFQFIMQSSEKISGSMDGEIITIDPTFGDTAIESSSFQIDNRIVGYLASPSTSGKDLYINASLYYTSAGGPWNIKCALYDSSGNFIASTEEKNLALTSSATWYRFNFSSPYPSVTASATYNISVWASDPAGTAGISYFSSGAPPGPGTARWKDTVYGVWPDSLTGETSTSDRISIFSKYTRSPSQSGPSPANSSTGVRVQPQCSITVSDPDADLMTVQWYENSTGSWVLRQTNSSCANGTYRWTFTQASASNHAYYWRVNILDSAYNVSSWYKFTTDGTPPTSSVDAISPYWKKTAATITATASDAQSGVKNVTLWYRFSSNNASWGGWVSAGVDSASPWSWSFSFSNGSGYYQFYSIARDNATNAESAPGSADAKCGYDNVAPTSSVNAISPYWKALAPQTFTGTASDSDTGPSGLKNTTLWYHYRTANTSTWGGWVNSGLVDTDPWVAVSWSFTFPNGTGHYQFYSIAKDNATNAESAPGSADAQCGYDNLAPSSYVNAISPYWKSSSPQTLTGTASDAGGTLFERYNTGDDGGFGGGNTLWKCQTFTVGNTGSNVTHYITSVRLKLFRTGSPGTITVGIRATNATGCPTGSDLTNGSIDGNSITSDSQGLWYRINFTTPYSLSRGTKYAIVVRAPSATGQNIFTWRFDSTSPTYSGGSYINGQNNGTIWGINLGLDLMFEEYSFPLSGLKNVTLWYRYRATNSSGFGGWVNSGLIDTDPWIAISWSFTFPNGTGNYQFYSIARDNATNIESLPASSDAFCGYDNVAPTSSVNTISPYWKNAAATITTTASDATSGVKNVTIWYRFSNDNNSWGGWVSAGVVSGSPWSWSFSFSNGSGYYQFYSIARDNAMNVESAPGSADAKCGYDNTAPSSSVNSITPYQTKSPKTITAIASDALSGVKNVTLWYRFSNNNASWGGWVSAGVVSASPWSWGFSFSNGSGYYEFYSIARDNATNTESAPGNADAWCWCDNGKPSSSVNTISPYMVYSSPLMINATASDLFSSVKNVTLWYRYSTDNSTWGSSWYNTNWMYRKKLTIDHTKVAATLSNFPVLVSLTDANLSAKAQSNGNDILFTTNTGTKLNHEIESYTNTTGTLVAWVNVTSVSSTADTVIYMYYGSPSASSQQNRAGTWDGNYVGVWHLKERSNPYNDSTGNNDNSTSGTYPAWVTGQIGYAQNFASASSQYISLGDVAPLQMRTHDWTTSAWIKTSGQAECMVSKAESADGWQMRITSTGLAFMMTKQGIGSVNSPEDGTVVNNGVWHYVAVRVVRSDKIYRYVDGSHTGTDISDASLNGQNISNDRKAEIGARDLIGLQNFFDGIIDEVRVSKIARSANWISTEFNNQYSPNTFISSGAEEPWVKWNNASNPDTSSPWSWNFNFPNGTGYYQFYSIANDTVGNKEDGPNSADTKCHYVYDVTKPSSNVTVISSPYWKKVSPLTISATASDTGGSGLKNVTLYYYNSSNNATWYGPWKFGAVTTPWSGISWSFTFPKGVGYYRFYSIAADNASNIEVFSGNDTRCGYDSVAPSSSVNAISPYWKKTNTIVITGTAADTDGSGLKNVTLYYRYRATNNTGWGGWLKWPGVPGGGGNPVTTPWLGISWTFNCPNGTGHYQFYSIATDNATNAESAPGSADALCGYDNVAPASSVNAIAPYWQKTSPLTITATASDALSGVKNVTLWYRFSSNNASWGGWVNAGLFISGMYGLSVSFSFSNGSGFYQFYSIATDYATNVESPPTRPDYDTKCGYDTVAPTSSVNSISPYWQRTSPLTVTVTASDVLSGVKNVTLWYRFSSNNASWGGWVSGGVVTAAPWSWSFSFSNGTGYYRFYSVARDNATNVESAPGSADAQCGYDNVAPSSSVNAISPYWKKTNTIVITGTAVDTGGSGLKNVTLYYRYRAINNTGWQGWLKWPGVYGGNPVTAPWLGISWTFNCPNGTGHYQFYSIATDNATNTESAPGSADAWCGYDNAAPASSVSAVIPYLRFQSPLTINATASDSGPSGLKNVTLKYRYALGNSSWGGWTRFGTSTIPWLGVSWSFPFSNGSGYYEFYSIACDNATNQEAAPGSADAKCRFLPLSIPTVLTNASTGVETVNATLHGYLQNDGGERCTVRFQCGTTTAYGTNTTNQSKSTGTPFSQNLTGLTPGHLYHFRAYANNTRGGSTGGDLTFLTKPNSLTSLVAVTNSSSKIYLTWIEGTGANTTRIQRKTGGYPTSITDGTNVYNQTGTHVEDTGLTPGTTYYYCAWSYSAWGTLHQWSDLYVSANATTKNVPVLSSENPANGSMNVILNTSLSLHVSHNGGYQMNITWYWGTTSSCPNFIGRNTSVVNGTYSIRNDGNFSSNSQTYYWRVTVNDGHGEWTNATYHFLTIPPNKKIISKGRGAYALEINPGGTLLYGYINGVSVQTTIDTSWHYVTLTYDGSHIRLYEDGTLRNSTSLSGSINVNAFHLFLGEYLSGKLDEVRVSSTARSAAWINTTYLDTNSPATFATFGSPVGVLSTWTYRKKVTINHAFVTSTLTNFPVLVFNASDVNLVGHALSTGNDILFMSSTENWITGTWRDKLDFEVEKFDHTTGELEAWVRIPTLSASVDTSVYLYYGNTLCNISRQNPTGVWDSNYCGVWHLKEAGTGAAGEFVDSTSKDNDGRGGAGNTSRVPTFTSSGKVDGANVFDGADDYVDVSGRSTLNITGSLTLEAWIHPDLVTSHRRIVQFSSNTTSPAKGYLMEIQGGQLHALLGLKGGTTSEILTGSIPTSSWTYLAVTWNTSVLKGFINGNFITNSTPNAKDIDNPNTLFRIGSGTTNTSYVDGILDEVRISNAPRGGAWINTTFNTVNKTNNFLWFDRQMTKNVAPTQGTPNPSIGALQQGLNPTLRITVNDTNQDAMNVTFRTNASGSWATIGTNTSVTNGSYQQQPSTMNYPGITYYWSVNVTDGLLWKNATYHFTTVPEVTFDVTASDGYLQNTSVTYATAHDAAGGAVSASAVDFYVGQKFGPLGYFVYRGFAFFDTSAIPDGATITSARLSLYGAADASDQDFLLVVQSGQPTSPHDPLTSYDYYHGNYSGNGGSLNTSGFSISGYNNITLNATGRSWINKTGMTKLCFRSNRDINSIPPTINEFIRIYASEKGNGFKPRLIVVYSK